MISEAGYFRDRPWLHPSTPSSNSASSTPLNRQAWSQRYIFERIEPQWTLQAAHVFHEFEKDDVVYIVMEEIQGETVEQLGSLGVAVERIGRALDEFIRIPPPDGSAIGPLDGSLMEHPMFPDVKAATHYGSKAALGDHIKRLTRDNLDVDFEEDAKILWPADFHDANFKFVGEKVYWFDYRNVNVLPDSFKIHDLTNSRFWIASNIGQGYLHLQPTTRSSMVRVLVYFAS
ncbi:hypothetical protein M407DRAFT_31401 [Tulasnella calospora MUT 4182]|uniref:Aminoglycoside phosphotransferase domain-containing protein n=1 Tax=Tulasnella calospora MUT 4182 TaxID=1051891 RepID=A0A0C3Q5M3_9AGAM|nr:hypothetical protein M407DRAFT_31401 [Tulasnella calospora MUT 4182]